MDGQKTTKDKILDMLHRMPDDIDYDRAIESIYVLSRIELGLVESDAGIGTEHEEFMRELLTQDEQANRHLDAAS